MPKRRDERYADLLPVFARRVRALREEAGLTQDELALRAHLSVNTLQNIERVAAPGNPRLTTLWALAAALGVPAASLVDAE